jgi:hypothetical protein
VRVLAASMKLFQENSYVRNRVSFSLLEVLSDTKWATDYPNSRLIAADLIASLLQFSEQTASSLDTCLIMLETADTTVAYRHPAYLIIRSIISCSNERIVKICIKHVCDPQSSRTDFEVRSNSKFLTLKRNVAKFWKKLLE